MEKVIKKINDALKNFEDAQNSDYGVPVFNPSAGDVSSLLAHNEVMRQALEFYKSGFSVKVNKAGPTGLGGGLTYHPTEALLDDCGNTAIEALNWGKSTQHPNTSGGIE